MGRGKARVASKLCIRRMDLNNRLGRVEAWDIYHCCMFFVLLRQKVNFFFFSKVHFHFWVRTFFPSMPLYGGLWWPSGVVGGLGSGLGVLGPGGSHYSPRGTQSLALLVMPPRLARWPPNPPPPPEWIPLSSLVSECIWRQNAAFWTMLWIRF